MKQIESFRELIELWPTFKVMARSIGSEWETVKSWHRRNRIPSRWWATILAHSRAKRAKLTAELLVGLADRRKT